MNPEDNKRMLAHSCVVADLKEDNMELVLHVKQLVIECNNVALQQNGKEKRKGKDSSKHSLGEMKQMRERCNYLERMNKELERYAKAIHTFVKAKNLYMKKGTSCVYKQGNPAVCSTHCLECDSCLGVIEGVGVVCDKRLAETSLVVSDNADDTDDLVAGLMQTQHFTNLLDKSRRE